MFGYKLDMFNWQISYTDENNQGKQNLTLYVYANAVLKSIFLCNEMQ